MSLDWVGKKPGRGAYVCPDEACLAKARKSRAIERAFEMAVDAAVYEGMEREIRERA